MDYSTEVLTGLCVSISREAWKAGTADSFMI